MSSTTPFSRDQDNKKKEQNWFMKTSIQAAAFAGTAFGVYGLWKISGPSRKILEKAVDDRMKKVIAEETYRSSDHFNEETENFIETRKEALSYLKDAYTTNVSAAWDLVNTSSGTKNHIKRLEAEVISRLEHEANLSSPSVQLITPKTGNKLDSETYVRLNRQGTYGYNKQVSLTGREAEELALARYRSIQKYLRQYGEATVKQIENPGQIDDLANMSDFFYSDEYIQPGQLKDGFGKKSTERVTTIHDSYMDDIRYAEIYLSEIKGLHTTMKSRDYAIAFKSIDNYRLNYPGGHRQILYGNIRGGVFDSKQFRVNPTLENIVEFDNLNSEVVIKKSLTSQGITKWDANSKWSKLQQTNYTGQISNLAKVLKGAKDEGFVDNFSIDLFDYGTSRNPDKRLRVTLVGSGTDKNAYWFEMPISIDGRLPGATPGLTQSAERFHNVGEAFGFIGAHRKEVNTSQLIMIDVARNLEGSLLKGHGNTFGENPKEFLRRIRAIVSSKQKENAASDGSIAGLVHAMTIDDPNLKDLVFSDRPRHAHMVSAAKNFVISARNTRKFINSRQTGRGTIIINLDLETLDNTGASPEKTLLTEAAQIVKAGIVVQDGNKVIASHELSNDIGYRYFKDWDNLTPGKGFNNNLQRWLKLGVLPENMQEGDIAENYKQYLEQVKKMNPEGWSNAKNNGEFVREISSKIQAIMDQASKDGKEVLIVTKNGLNFDLKSFLMYDPAMHQKLKEKSVDIQALHWFRNAGLGEANALKLESVVRAMMGRLGVRETDYISKGDIVPEKIIRILRKKSRSVQGQDTILLDWTADAFKKFHKHKMTLRAHASPKVDAALSAALFGEIIGDYTAGEADYVNAADHMERLLKEIEKGPPSPEFLLKLYRMSNNKTLRGFNYDVTSQGMISQLNANYIDMNDLNVIMSPHSAVNRRMVASPFNMTLNKDFVSKMGGNRASLSKQFLGRFTVSEAVEDATRYIVGNHLKVSDDPAHFSNTVKGNFVYRLDLAEKDATISLTKEYMNMFERRMTMSVITHGEGAIYNNKLKRFVDLTFKKAQEIAGNGKTVVREHLEMAEDYIRKHPPSDLGDWKIKLSEEILSANKFGGEVAIPTRSQYGEIKGVLVERDTVGSGRNTTSRLLAKIEYVQSGFEMSASSQFQILGSHGTLTLAQGVTDAAGAFGRHRIHGFAGAEFLKKADVGAFKNIMLNTILTELTSKIDDKNVPQKIKIEAKALLSEITKTLNATADLKNNKFIFKKNSGVSSPISEQTRIYGSTEVRLSQFTEWYRKAGLVWSQEELKQLNSEDIGIYKKYEDEFKAYKDDYVKQMKSKHDVFTVDQVKSIEDDLNAITSMFQVEHDGQAGIKAFQLFNFGGGKTLGLVSLNDVGAIYNHDPTTSRSGTSMFRQDYLFGIAWSLQGKNKTTMEYLTKYTYGKLDARYKSALATGLSFNNALFVEELVKNKSLNISQINSIVDVQKRVEERREKQKIGQKKWSNFSYQDLAAAYKDTQTLLESEIHNKDPLVIKQLDDEAKDLSEMLGGKTKMPHVFERIQGLSHVYATSDIKKIEELALKGQGVLQFELPRIAGSDVLNIDLEHHMDRAFSEGLGVDFSSYELKKYKDKLIHVIKMNQDHSKKGAPIKVLDDGRLELGAAIFDWDPTRMNNFNLTDGLDLASHETQIKIQAMEALNKYQTIVTAAHTQGKNPNDVSPVKGAQDEFVRKYLTYLLVGQAGDKSSNFWKSGQFAVESTRLIHKDINSVWSNIHQIESNSGFSDKYLGTINAIKKARLDTVLVHEEAFRSFKYSKMSEVEELVEGKKVTRWVNHDGGERVSAAKVISDNLKAEGFTNSEIGEYFTGRKALPGGIFARFPITQAGSDGVRTGKYLVIPKEVSKIIGLDQNSVYTNPVYLAAQKADFDGDQIFTHLKELATIKKFKEIAEEDDRMFQQIMDLPHVTEELKSSAISYNDDGTLTRKVKIGSVNSVIAHRGDKTIISTLNIRGENEFKTVATSMLDFSDVVKHTVGLIEESAKRGGRATSVQLLAASEATSNTLISKHLIPLTTNLLKQRMFELIGSDTGTVKNPLALMSFMGNLKHGIAGMAQGVIEMGKHAEKAAALSATYDWLKDPTKEAPKAKEYYMQMRMEQTGKAFDMDLEESGWNFFSGKLRDFSIIRKNSPTFKMYEDRALDFLMGKGGATRMDILNVGDLGELVQDLFSEGPAMQERSLMGDLNDALSTRFSKQIDVTPHFKKAGKYGAIGAGVFLGLGMFTPFGNSKSLNPVDMFIDLGNINGNRSAISSSVELGRGSPLEMVDASFSKEAFIRINKGDRNEKKNRSTIISSMLMNSSIVRTEGQYEFQSKPYKSYANYTTRVPTFGTNELKRRSEL